MIRFGLLVGVFALGCQPAPFTPSKDGETPGKTRRWSLVERPYEQVDPWIRNSLDADLASGEMTLVFEPIEVEGDGKERLRLLLQASRCLHRLRITGDVPDETRVGEPVEITLLIDCGPSDTHRVDITPTRSGVRILGFRGTSGDLPNLGGFYMRGPAKVVVRFTADSKGLGGIKAVLSEVGLERPPAFNK